jgi:hypothetical protein
MSLMTDAERGIFRGTTTPEGRTQVFKHNVGTIDRVLRAAIGIAALVAFFMLPDATWRWWLLIGLVPLGTALLGTCPIYTVFGLSTCPIKRT